MCCILQIIYVLNRIENDRPALTKQVKTLVKAMKFM